MIDVIHQPLKHPKSNRGQKLASKHDQTTKSAPKSEEYIPNYIKAAPILRPENFRPRSDITFSPVKLTVTKPLRTIEAPKLLPSAETFKDVDDATIDDVSSVTPSEPLDMLVENLPKQPIHQLEFNPPEAEPSFAPRFETITLLIACVVLGISSINLALGQVAVGIYALASVVFKIRSETSFTLSLLAFVCVPMFALLNNGEMAEVFAVYAFFLLVIGVFAAILELKKADRRIS